jgi:exopolysaccharide biosynthesis WecB/TagA/CpsF family protein
MQDQRRSAGETPPGQGVSIEGVTINLPTLAAATAEAVRRAELGKGFLLFTLNLDDLVKVRSIARFAAVYRRADLVCADGWPIVWLAARQGARLERTCGADLVEPLCRAAGEHDLKVYFIGPGPLSQGRAIDDLSRRIKGFRPAGAEAPRIPAGKDPSILAAIDIDAIAGRLNASGARLCFVSLGHPKQGFLAEALAKRCPKVGFVCVGAALDFIAGSVRRAPAWMQQAGLEWFWRLTCEPRRLAVRYVVCAWVFFSLVLKLSFRRSAPGAPARRSGDRRAEARSPLASRHG